MDQRFERQAMLIGNDATEKLHNATVAVFGIGGVGSYVVEALARAGVGHLILVDADVVSLSNINRQLIALSSTVGRPKVDVMRDRVLDIWPDAKVDVHEFFYSKETADRLDLTDVSYVVDAIDSVSSKILLVEQARLNKVPIISCMGAGNKLDPSQFEIADIYQTSVCPLAKVMRRELRKRQIPSLKVVYSKEIPTSYEFPDDDDRDSACDGVDVPLKHRRVPGSMSFVPSVAGLILAGEVIREIAL